jgi:hypothetical protein
MERVGWEPTRKRGKSELLKASTQVTRSGTQERHPDTY